MSKTLVEYCSNCEQLARELGRLKEQLAKSKEEKGEPFLSKQAADLRRELAAIKMVGDQLFDALVWCSGSDDFCPGGTAQAGWKKHVFPVLSAWRKVKGEGK